MATFAPTMEDVTTVAYPDSDAEGGTPEQWQHYYATLDRTDQPAGGVLEFHLALTDRERRWLQSAVRIAAHEGATSYDIGVIVLSVALRSVSRNGEPVLDGAVVTRHKQLVGAVSRIPGASPLWDEKVLSTVAVASVGAVYLRHAFFRG